MTARAIMSLYAGIALSGLIAGVIYLRFANIDPYMDEIFHIPQAQIICSDDFHTWNAKITTFPGMYYLSYLLHLLFTASCSPAFLRLLNVAISILIPVAAYNIRQRTLNTQPMGYSTPSQTVDCIFTAVFAYLYPLSYLYYFLYYTDTCSLYFFLLTYANGLRMVQDERIMDRCGVSRCRPSLQSKLILLTVSSTCIFMRQTNAIWVMFIVGMIMLEEVKLLKLFRDEKFTAMQVIHFVRCLWAEKWHLLAMTLPLIVPVLAFVAFIISNGSIVLGDKENHQPTVHSVMALYPFVIYLLLSLPRLALHLADSCFEKKTDIGLIFKCPSVPRFTAPIQTSFVAIAIFSISTLIFAFGSRSHPFLLADNRHYTFYLWNRILKYDRVRFLLSPFFGGIVTLALFDMSRSRGLIWMLIYCVALILTLMPTPLLEFRYFTQGVIVAMLHSPPLLQVDQNLRRFGTLIYAFQIAALLMINAVVVHVFLDKSFIGADGEISRFMF